MFVDGHLRVWRRTRGGWICPTRDNYITIRDLSDEFQILETSFGVEIKWDLQTIIAVKLHKSFMQQVLCRIEWCRMQQGDEEVGNQKMCGNGRGLLL